MQHGASATSMHFFVGKLRPTPFKVAAVGASEGQGYMVITLVGGVAAFKGQAGDWPLLGSAAAVAFACWLGRQAPAITALNGTGVCGRSP